LKGFQTIPTFASFERESGLTSCQRSLSEL
jgi:hypothetical protein